MSLKVTSREKSPGVFAICSEVTNFVAMMVPLNSNITNNKLSSRLCLIGTDRVI